MTPKDAQALLTFLTSPQSALLECTLGANIKIQKNIKILTEYVEDLKVIRDSFLKPSQETLEYDSKKFELLAPYLQYEVLKDGTKAYIKANGVPQLVPGTEATVSNLLEEFNLEHVELLSKVSLKKKEWLSFYHMSEADVDIKYISREDVDFPEKFNKASYEALMLMIKD